MVSRVQVDWVEVELEGMEMVQARVNNMCEKSAPQGKNRDAVTVGENMR
jgi:hypothetical protein